MAQRRILDIGIDFDMVTNNWEGPNSPFLREWNNVFKGTLRYIPAVKAEHWECSYNYPEEFREAVRSIYVNPKPGFYTDMPLMEKAAWGIQALRDMGHRLYCVTVPIMEVDHELERFFQNSLRIRTDTWIRVVMEKKNYLLKHFGKDAPPLYPIEDKRMFNGNYLIDDNPRLSSVARAPWHHILFDRGYKYNQNNGKVGQLKGDWEYVVKKIDELSLYTVDAE